MIRVGFKQVEPRELGFHSYYIITVHDSDWKPVHVHVLKRHDEPLVLITQSKDVSISHIAEAHTRRLDYPTKPFLKALELLKKQQELFLEKVAEVYRGDTKTICCSAVSYIADIAGVLKFALRMRGEEVSIPIDCFPLISKDKLVEIEKAIERASEPAPSLGNGTYIDIAEEAYDLLKATLLYLKMLYNKGGILGCACDC